MKQKRRDFIKTCAVAGVSIGSGIGLSGLLNACASVPEGPIKLPPVATSDGNLASKIQPADNGCFVGFYGSDADASYYEAQVGKRPLIVIPSYWTMRRNRNFLLDRANYIDQQGCLMLIYKTLESEIIDYGLSNLSTSPQFTKDVKEYAKQVLEFGKPFFLDLMPEINFSLFNWSHSKQSKEAYKTFWEIMEGEGANQFATYVWHGLRRLSGGNNNSRYSRGSYDAFFPDDEKYVDWIGFSIYARTSQGSGNYSLAGLTRGPYSWSLKNHPDKPFMIVELGKTKEGKGKGQARWLEKGYAWIKKNPGIKSVTYFDNTLEMFGPTSWYDNHHLSGYSFDALEHILADSYWIGSMEMGT